MDWLPTFAAVAGDSEIKEQLKTGLKLGARDYKVHLDGYNLLPLLTGKEKKGQIFEIDKIKTKRKPKLVPSLV